MLRGDRLKTLRENKGYTHQELADLLNVGSAQIWRYEVGKTAPSADVLARIAQVFDVSVDYLLNLTDEPLPPAVLEGDLSAKERNVVAALRRGENYEAIKLIVGESE
jgi:transcriptional regulator with XRE-family HTH domain